MKGTKGIKQGLAILLAFMLLIFGGCGKEETVPAEETGTPVAYLGEEPIYLEEALFYTRMLQEQWEYSYYEHYGEDMWQHVVSDEIGTLEDALKSDVLEILTELHLLCAHAEEYGVELTGEEQKTIAERAGNFMSSNTPSVLEAAGATQESVTWYLMRNELAAKVAEAIQADYDPELTEEDAAVGKLTYCLFSTMGTYDEAGNFTAFTEEELEEIRQEAETFAELAQELGDISAAGEAVSHTVIDVYFNDTVNGGAHELVADTVRAMEPGGISGVIETEDGYYVVQRVSEYDAEATAENLELLTQQARADYLAGLETSWEEETPLVVESDVWESVRIEEMLADI